MTNQSPLEKAYEYFKRGWAPLPVPFRSKSPNLKDWQKFRVTEAELPNHFNGKEQNIGVILGKSSGDLVDVDIDCVEARELAPQLLPATGAVFGRETNPRSHWLFVVPVSAKVTFNDAVTGERLLEILTNGQQAIFPGSFHKDTGELIRWYDEGEPSRVDKEDLLKATRTLAAATLLTRYWPQQGSRQESALALAGALLKAGWSQEETMRFIEVVCAAAGDEEVRQRMKTAPNTLRTLEGDRPVTGWPTLARIIDERIVARVREWLQVDQRTVASTQNWSEPQPLPDDLLPVPALNSQLLPEPLKAWIGDISDRMQCPPEFPSVAALVAAASIVGNRVRICPKRADAWTIVPNLWGAVVGRPGMLKSPALQEAFIPMKARERLAREEYERGIQDFSFERDFAEAQKTHLRGRMKKAKDASDKEALRKEYVAAEIPIPIERRYIVNDPTVEKLGELLNQNPRGLLLFRDELVGWLKALDREGREQDRSFYLETWDGKGEYVYDRIGRGTLRISNMTLSILGGIQPGPLMHYLHGALHGGVGDDGLIQRFQLLVYPDGPTTWRNIDRVPDGKATARAHRCFSELDKLAIANPQNLKTLRFSPEAQDLFNSWRCRLETSLLSSRFEHDAFRAHMSKYRSLMPSLALLFHLIDVVDGITASEGISLEAAQRSIEWCSFFEAHARRVYGLALSSKVSLARRVLQHVLNGDLLPEFTSRDIYRNQWAGLVKPAEVTEALRVLEDFGWLRPFTTSSGEQGGRKGVRYVIHPAVLGRKAVA
jgi:Protein of unknown function (DUF3987)/Bifunctional DNA primase/polymerase, N-terminal